MKEEKESINSGSQKIIPENTGTVGHRLKTARLKKGRTIEAVNHETRMSKSFIEAMEEDHFNKIPGGSYLRSFIKGYCEYLDLDFKEIWDQVVSQSAPANTPPQKEGLKENPSSAHVAPQETLRDFAKKDFNWKPKNVGVTVLVFIMATLLLFSPWILSRFKKTKPIPPKIPVGLKPFQAPESGESLSIEFMHSTFLAVSIDGDRRFRGRAPAGTRQIWKAQKEIILWPSDPAALKILLNGIPFQLSHPDKRGNYHIHPGDHSSPAVSRSIQHGLVSHHKIRMISISSPTASPQGTLSQKKNKKPSLNLQPSGH